MRGSLGFFGFVTEWLAFRLPDTIISNSVHTTKRLHAAGVMAEIITIPLGIDVSAVQNVTPSSHTSDIIFVGRLLSHKNIPILLDAVSLIKKDRPNISLTIVGDGPEKENIESYIAQNGLQDNVTVRTDIASDSEKYALLKSSGVFVLPSEREGFGTVLVEANTAGVPVVTVNCPDNAGKDLINEGVNGVVVSLISGDIAQAITHVLDTRNAFNPTHIISMYDWDSVANRCIEVFSIKV